LNSAAPAKGVRFGSKFGRSLQWTPSNWTVIFGAGHWSWSVSRRKMSIFAFLIERRVFNCPAFCTHVRKLWCNFGKWILVKICREETRILQVKPHATVRLLIQ
jgi:hypothetical protein